MITYFGQAIKVQSCQRTPLNSIWSLWILLLCHQANIKAEEPSIIPFMPQGVGVVGGDHTILRSFLEPCETITLQTQCTEEEYESNEDCLPQKSDNCNHSKELFCLSGVCLPNCHPHKETYDNIEGKCFRKVGSDCRVQNNSTTIQQTLYDPDQSNSTKHDNDNSGTGGLLAGQDHPTLTTTVIIPECEKNAVCERGQCRCGKNFTYDHNFNKCVLYASYLAYCDERVNCDRKSDIVCEENQCQCKSPETQYFHLKRKRCYIRVGQVCSSGLQFCPDNSNCVREKISGDGSSKNSIKLSGPEYQWNWTRTSSSPADHEDTNAGHHRLFLLYQDLIINGEIRENDHAEDEDEHFIGILGDDDDERGFACKCDKGYGSSKDKRLCLGLHNTRCNTLHRCNTERGLKCINGICLCERESVGEQVYSDKFQTCFTILGASCSDDSICSIGASCKEGKCTCNDDLTPLSSSAVVMSSDVVAHACMKSHGIPCKNSNGNSSQENDLFQPRCNLEIGLECSTKEERCLCKDSNQFYDTSKGKCESFQGIDRKIPIVHFTPPADREYTFRKNKANCESSIFYSKFILCMGLSLLASL